MYKNYKIYVNTAAGRRRYMQYLIPYIVSCPLVDRYDIWINTHNGADIEYFKRIAEKFPVINLVWQPDGVVDGNKSINAFYKQCIDEDAVYFKLDDDIVWMEPDAMEKMIRFRVDNPEYQVVSPLVINNSLSTYLLQIEEKIKLDQYYNSESSHPVLWKSPQFALELHNWFIDKIKQDAVSPLHMGVKAMGMTRFSINAILWFGKDMAAIGGIVPGDDEEFMSCIWTTMTGRPNAWYADAVIAHFAFFTQREILDQHSILESYGELCKEQWKKYPELGKAADSLNTILYDIDKNQASLMANPSPYRKVVHTKTWKMKVKESMPKWLQSAWAGIYEYKHTTSNGFILK